MATPAENAGELGAFGFGIIAALSGRSFQIIDDLPQDRLIEDLLLLSTASHQGVSADEVNLSRYPLAVVIGLGHEAIAEQC